MGIRSSVEPPSFQLQRFGHGCGVSLRLLFAMSSRLQTLRDQLAAVSQGIKNVTQLENAQKKRQRDGASVRPMYQLSARVARVVWIMYSMCADPSLAVLHVLRAERRRSRLSVLDDAELLRIAEESFLGAGNDVFLAATDLGSPSDPEALRIAQQRLAEMRLYNWVEMLNVEKGVAPSTVEVVRRARQEGDALPHVVFASHAWGRPSKRALKWARSFRLRWGCRLGTLRVREKMQIPEMVKKVTRSFSQRYYIPRVTECERNVPQNCSKN